MELLPGTWVVPLRPNEDRRGTLTEIFREIWVAGMRARQVNLMKSVASSLRGSHVHRKHIDYFVLVTGRAVLGMRDVRKASSAFGLVSMIELKPEGAIVVPPGVVHAVHFKEDSTLITIESEYFFPAEEVHVRWDDPELKIPWEGILLPPNGKAVSFTQMMETIEPWQDEWRPSL